MANRFEKPLKGEYMQTYVSQYVPMPLDIMQKAADNAQQHYDQVAKNIEAQQAFLQKLKSHTGKPTEEMEGILNNYQMQLDDMMNSGDLRLAEGKVRKLGRALGDDYRAGELAKYVRAGKTEADFFKLQQEQRNKKVGEGGVSMQKKYLQDRYHERTQKEGFTDELGSILTSKGLTSGSADLNSDAFEIAKQVKANQTDTKAKYQGTFDAIHQFASIKRKGVGYDEIEKVTAAGLLNNPDDYDELKVRAMYDKAIATGVDITEVEVTQDDIYAEALDASRAAANAYAYSETDIQDYFQKSTGFSAGEDAKLNPAFTYETQEQRVVKASTSLNNIKEIFVAATAGTEGGFKNEQEAIKNYTNFALKGVYLNENNEEKPIIGNSGINYKESIDIMRKNGASDEEIQLFTLEAARNMDIPLNPAIQGTNIKKYEDALDQGYKQLKLKIEEKKQVYNEQFNKLSKADQDLIKNYEKQIAEKAFNSWSDDKIQKVITKGSKANSGKFSPSEWKNSDLKTIPPLNTILETQQDFKKFAELQATYENEYFSFEGDATNKALAEVMASKKKNGTLKGDALKFYDKHIVKSPSYLRYYSMGDIENSIDNIEYDVENVKNVKNKLTEKVDGILEDRAEGTVVTYRTRDIPEFVNKAGQLVELKGSTVKQVRSDLEKGVNGDKWDGLTGVDRYGNGGKSLKQLKQDLIDNYNKEHEGESKFKPMTFNDITASVQFIYEGEEPTTVFKITDLDGKSNTLVTTEFDMSLTAGTEQLNMAVNSPNLNDKVSGRMNDIKASTIADYPLEVDYKGLDKNILVSTPKRGDINNAATDRVVFRNPDGTVKISKNTPEAVILYLELAKEKAQNLSKEQQKAMWKHVNNEIKSSFEKEEDLDLNYN
jgi:hypothetical protein